jgi:hypothetical protein
VTTQKQSPAFLNDPLYLRNYVNIRVKDQLARIPGVGQIRLFGGGDWRTTPYGFQSCFHAVGALASMRTKATRHTLPLLLTQAWLVPC